MFVTTMMELSLILCQVGHPLINQSRRFCYKIAVTGLEPATQNKTR